MKLPLLALFAGIALLAQGPDFTPPTPLIAAAMRNDTSAVKRLLSEGANPNEARLIGSPPIFFAIVNHNLEMTRALVAHGADVHATDGAGSTTLMWAAASEDGRPDIVNELLKLGVKPNATNQMGETALQWALRRGQTPIVASLNAHGATDTARAKAAVERAIGLLQKSGDQFVRVSGCTSCHHQSVPQMAIGMARQRGFAVNEKIAKQQAAAVIAMFEGARELMLRGTDRIPDPTISVSYALLGLGAEAYPPNETTSAMAYLISTKQRPDGSFPSFPARPPIESSDIASTALSLRAIQRYGQKPESAVDRAREWLRTQNPRTNEERAMQLLGLAWAQADATTLAKFGQGLLAEQRPDGGWAQLATLESDAYATGQALYALSQAGQTITSDTPYQRGAGFLLRTQMSDGSWLVRTRAFPFQPYQESGFPYGKDQWISASGTGWAALALSLASAPIPVTNSDGQ
jgi:hypothetical protein